MSHIIEHEGILGLFKGMGPQIAKGVIVQGILMMTKERYEPGLRDSFAPLTVLRMEILFALLFAYMRQLRSGQLQRLADVAAEKAKQVVPIMAKS